MRPPFSLFAPTSVQRTRAFASRPPKNGRGRGAGHIPARRGRRPRRRRRTRPSPPPHDADVRPAPRRVAAGRVSPRRRAEVRPARVREPVPARSEQAVSQEPAAPRGRGRAARVLRRVHGQGHEPHVQALLQGARRSERARALENPRRARPGRACRAEAEPRGKNIAPASPAHRRAPPSAPPPREGGTRGDARRDGIRASRRASVGAPRARGPRCREGGRARPARGPLPPCPRPPRAFDPPRARTPASEPRQHPVRDALIRAGPRTHRRAAIKRGSTAGP